MSHFLRFQEYGDYDTELLPRGRRRSSLSDTIPPLRGNNANYEDENMVSYCRVFFTYHRMFSFPDLIIRF